jgi:hypothetical protein
LKGIVKDRIRTLTRWLRIEGGLLKVVLGIERILESGTGEWEGN